MMLICRVQARIRGFLQRRRYRIKKSTYEMATKYFKSEEGKETLRGQFEANGQTQKRTFTYSTGAHYDGEWRGGLRHGSGTMKWADGAIYTGQW